MIFLDTETDLIRPGLLAPPVVCVQFAVDDGPVAVAVDGVDPVAELVAEMLRGATIVGHNVAYDMLVLMRAFPSLVEPILSAYEDGRVSDTLIREKLLLIERGSLWKARAFSLAALAGKYGDTKDANDPWRLRYSELRGVPFDAWPLEAKAYAVHDVEATRTVYHAQGPTTPDEARQVRAAMVMHVIGATGIYTDPEATEAFEQKVEALYHEDQMSLVREGLVRAGGVRNMAAAKVRMQAVMEGLGIEPRLTKKKAISLDEEACDLAGDELLSAFQRYGSHKNLLSRLQGLKEGYDTPINPRFNSLVETGRTSCTKGTPGGPTNGYQVQNMRRMPGERECFIPEPGEVILASDFDGFENGSFAQVCLWTVGHSKMAEGINAGLDVHLWMVSLVWGEDYDGLLAILKDPEHPRHKEVKTARQGCKIANFGYPGGMGATSFVGYARGYGMSLTVAEAEELKAQWLRTWPEASLYFAWINGHPWHPARRGEHEVEETSVKQLRSNRVRGGVSYTEACNGYWQGLASDAAKEAGWALLRATETGSLRDWGIWNFVHDEYILRGPEADGHRAALIVKELMETAAGEWMPDVKVTASPTLMRRWSKDAEPVWEGGRLVPWEAPCAS